MKNSKLNGHLTLISQCVGHVNGKSIMHFNGYLHGSKVSAIHIRDKFEGVQDFKKGKEYIVNLDQIEVSGEVLTSSYTKFKEI